MLVWIEGIMDSYEQMHLYISGDVERLMEERMIPRETVLKAIHEAESTGQKFSKRSTARSLAFHRPKTVTYWVEYSRIGEEYQVHSAYSHRMGMKSGGGLTTDNTASVYESGWICNLCKAQLEVQTVRLQYMQCIFPHNLPVCPHCSVILIAEELATGKMAEAEQALEDK
ncbi:MAG: hypothetical protein PHF56_08745 [Desulfuromonadaceae bacterium]|nr:hypothetical protein [Desulfuromonadaceae bacterium]